MQCLQNNVIRDMRLKKLNLLKIIDLHTYIYREIIFIFTLASLTSIYRVGEWQMLSGKWRVWFCWRQRDYRDTEGWSLRPLRVSTTRPRPLQSPASGQVTSEWPLPGSDWSVEPSTELLLAVPGPASIPASTAPPRTRDTGGKCPMLSYVGDQARDLACLCQ